MYYESIVELINDSLVNIVGLLVGGDNSLGKAR